MDPNLEKLHTGKSETKNEKIKESPRFTEKWIMPNNFFEFDLFSIDIQYGLWMDPDPNAHEMMK